MDIQWSRTHGDPSSRVVMWSPCEGVHKTYHALGEPIPCVMVDGVEVAVFESNCKAFEAIWLDHAQAITWKVLQVSRTP